jgi:hypothetical protein
MTATVKTSEMWVYLGAEAATDWGGQRTKKLDDQSSGKLFFTDAEVIPNLRKKNV